MARPLSISACARPKVDGRDRAEALGEGGFQRARIHEARNLVEEPPLCFHVGGLEHRAREHELPVGRHALALEGYHVEALRIVDQREATLRRDQFGDLGHVLIGVGGREHEARCAQSQRRDLGSDRLGVIDDVMGTELAAPGGGLGPRGGGDDGQIRELAGELRRDGSDAAPPRR